MNICRYDVHEPDYDVLFSSWYSTALAWERFPLQAFTGRVSPFGPLPKNPICKTGLSKGFPSLTTQMMLMK